MGNKKNKHAKHVKHVKHATEEENFVKDTVIAMRTEISHMRSILPTIIYFLSHCDDETDFGKVIDDFKKLLPNNLKFLKNRRETYILWLNHVCSGEMSPEEALKSFQKDSAKLYEALNCFRF